MTPLNIINRDLHFLGVRAWLLLGLAFLLGTSFSQEYDVEPPRESEVVPDGPREVIKQTVTNKGDHTVTVRQVVPPEAVTRDKPVADPEQSEGDPSRLANEFVMATATSFDQRATLMEWWMDGERFQAWSPANLRYLDGLLEFEDRGIRFSVKFLVAQRKLPEASSDQLNPRQRLILAGPDNRALGNQPLLVAGSENNGRAMDFLYAIHDHYNRNREALAAAYEAKILERKTAPLADPSQKPKNSTVTYWKYHQPKK